MDKKFRVRFRFRISRGLTYPGAKATFTFQNRTVELSSQDGETLLQKPGWVVMNVREIPTLQQAVTLGKQLKAAVLLAATCCRIGIDVGKDKATMQWSDTYKAARKEFHGEIQRDNVHGLDVFEDLPNIVFSFMNANMSVTSKADDFFDEVNRLSNGVAELPNTEVPLRLLNSAVFASDPLAALVLAVASVEMLVKKSAWSVAQITHLRLAAAAARSDASMTAEESAAVADAIERSYNPGVNEGIRQLLARLGLADTLGARWKAMYQQRSKIIHGLVAADEVILPEAANEAILICCRIVLRAAQIEGADISTLAERYYPLN